MPIVNIDLREGQDPKQIKALVADVTQAIAKNAVVPEERVHIIVNEHDEEHFS
ncbi:tautomerase family protein [Lentilactobacillus senioris]|uniref:2-hydroxymuconate tautomerase n=1 Tax=Lentilactobacillus senioris TaxID=931534 RepID=UPI00227EE84C|nr:2-hydroxymuconate tautomerase [Lentilactobacillus senioris]MCY9806835.1 tautomerase family protein [Lentilactobacillus senioris]